MTTTDPAAGLPTPQYLGTRLRYAPDTGLLTWTAPRNGQPMGTLAGWTQHPASRIRAERRVRIDGREYAVHRVIWAIHTGAWPTGVVAFRDEDALNLKWDNLFLLSEERAKERAAAVANRRARPLPPGVSRHVRLDGTVSFSAHVQSGGRGFSLGTFDTPEEAHSAYLEAKADPAVLLDLRPSAAETAPRRVSAEPKSATRTRILQAIQELGHGNKAFSRQQIVDATGLRLAVADDHLDRLRDEGKVVRLIAGVYELVREYPPTVPISYTPLPEEGILIMERVDVVWKLGYPDVRQHALMLAGFLEQSQRSQAEAEMRQAITMLQVDNRQRRKEEKKRATARPAKKQGRRTALATRTPT